MSVKKDVRLQVFITNNMDDKLDDMASIMGLHKNEIVRVAIANYLYGYGQSVNLVRELVTSGDVSGDDLLKRLGKVADKPF